MKILIVRHADPDYEHDSLTATGWKEAEMLSEILVNIPATSYYVSPLGRAKDTASCTLDKLDKKPLVLDWLREFPPGIHRPDVPEICSPAWDWLPQDWTKDERFFSKDEWYNNEIMQSAGVKEAYEKVITGFDSLLSKHGYTRNGRYYNAENANNDTIIIFCHFGVECVLLSHLMNVSPMILWHGMCALPSSVTTVVTEERRKGIAYFRTLRFGDLSHLALHGEEPSFAARFCEKFGNPGERID